MVLPIASVCSTRPPVSVLVRAPEILPRGFYMKHGITDFTHSLRRNASFLTMSGFSYSPNYALSRGRPEPRPAILLRHPIGITFLRWYRNVYLLCIDYALRPRLSSRLTLGGLALPRKPWTYGGNVFHVSLVTHASIRTSIQSTDGYPLCFNPYGTLPYH